MLITSEELSSHLTNELPSCGNLNVISAFVTKTAVDWFIQLLPEYCDVCVVGRFTPSDFIQGASDVEAIEKAILKGYDVKALSNLHAKIYQLDVNTIFTGSANMTAKGLALVDNSNFEACSRVAPTETNIEFINKILDCAITIDEVVLEKMKRHLEEFENMDQGEIPDSWPDSVMLKVEALFVSDFPIVAPSISHDLYKVNPFLEFAQIHEKCSNFKDAQKLFKNSKAYLWLKKAIDRRTDGVRFGELSQLLHSELKDDPAPYRQDIKTLQSNLYKFVELYANDEMEIFTPGKRSQFIKLI